MVFILLISFFFFLCSLQRYAEAGCNSFVREKYDYENYVSVNLCSRPYLMKETVLASETSCLNKQRYDEKGPLPVTSALFWNFTQL
jgi:hypothetical protein